jgi:ABC-type Fe3+-hydroxamate transport system substrate-binding protein
VPSLTETLVAWGIPPVAVTRFCEQPGIRTVGGTKDPDVAAIVELAPDLVVVNDEENRRDDASALAAAGVQVHVTRIRTVADVDACLDDLADAVGVARPPGERAAFHRIDADSVGEAAQGPSDRRTVFVPIWRRPWMTMNGTTYGASLLELLGLLNVYGAAAERYPTVDLDDVTSRRPQLVLLPSEPYPFKERHRVDLEVVVGADVRLVDGQDLFWWGARTPAAIERLRQAIGS